MADTATVALTGLAGVLSGLVKRKADKIAKDAETVKKKTQELKDQKTLLEIEALKMEQGMTQMRNKAQRDFRSRLMNEGTRATPSGNEIPGIVGPPEGGVTRAQMGGAGFPAADINAQFGPIPKPVDPLKEEQAKFFRGLNQPGGQGGGGGPLVTGARIGGMQVEFPGPTAQMEALKTRTREQNKPLPSSVQDKVSSLMDTKSELQKVIQNFKPEFVGKGFQGSTGGLTSGFRDFTGQMSTMETTMRQSLANSKDNLLRARSGAQINEQEYQRLSKLFPDDGMLGNEPLQFMSRLFNAMDAIEKTIQNKLKLATTPSGKLGTSEQGSIALPDGTVVTRTK